MLKRAPAGIAVAVAVLVTAGTVSAAATVAVRIDKHATLVEAGRAVDVDVAVKCASGNAVLEAFVYVVHDDDTSNVAGIPVVCDSKRHVHRVRVTAGEVPFGRGEARASAYVLLASGESTSPSREIRIR